MVRSAWIRSCVFFVLGTASVAAAQQTSGGGECRCMQTFVGASHAVQCEGFVYENNSRCACEPYESDGHTWCRPKSYAPPTENRSPSGAERRRGGPQRG